MRLCSQLERGDGLDWRQEQAFVRVVHGWFIGVNDRAGAEHGSMDWIIRGGLSEGTGVPRACQA